MMIMPSDKDYQLTRKIMLGEAEMDPRFRRLAAEIDSSFGVRTINIILDKLEDGRGRLNICVEKEQEKKVFYDPSNSFRFDAGKQAMIAGMFSRTVQGAGDIWVIFSAFEPVAKIEANEAIPQESILALKRDLGHPDLWEISRCFSGATFFVYTDRQVEQFRESETRKVWTNAYFGLLERYDKFGYFHRETFSIGIDSKENFDNNYQGNWYYYYK